MYVCMYLCMHVSIYLLFVLWYILESMCIYPALALEPALTCFNGKWCRESNIWVVGGVHCYCGIMLPGLPSGQI